MLVFVGALIDDGPGGNYSASSVASYLERGHRPAVFIAEYMALLGVAALFFLLAWLRDSLADPARSSVFWALSIAGTATFIAGWAMHMTVPVAMAYGGSGVTVGPTVTYVVSEGGYIVLLAGAVLIGLALFTLVLSRSALPGWVRGITAVGALGAVTAPAFFPFALFFLWALGIGIWLPRPVSAIEPATA